MRTLIYFLGVSLFLPQLLFAGEGYQLMERGWKRVYVEAEVSQAIKKLGFTEIKSLGEQNKISDLYKKEVEIQGYSKSESLKSFLVSPNTDRASALCPRCPDNFTPDQVRVLAPVEELPNLKGTLVRVKGKVSPGLEKTKYDELVLTIQASEIWFPE